MILIFGGTSDSLDICDWLNARKRNYMVSVATDYGEKLVKQHADQVIGQRLDEEGMCRVMREKAVSLVIDATHPFAVEVSGNAMNAANKMKIPYIRYERPSGQADHLHLVRDIDEACQTASALGNRIFLATGSKNLPQYLEKLPGKYVIARVLPVSEVVAACEQLGLLADQIIAMKGPFSQSLNKELFKQTGAEVMITKESGAKGGFAEKVEACKELGIPCVVIRRPSLNYPEVLTRIDELEKYV
ncbi:precorrin-6A reductase [Paenibacillus larvae]|uniref:precorrin-6A reductase n=1 Tax=Paenibacillus larvae TaxID=1464 RepID=UPI0022810E85|nr:precorrin-6A reductase [Paenibacillus larvae]MCY9511614.1 precorrin-6A reductase [Paenibacillus larvae]MCY9527254.1 precorrin-6A reductase [Paenibacillus larvae]